MLMLFLYTFHDHADGQTCKLAVWFDTHFLWG